MKKQNVTLAVQPAKPQQSKKKKGSGLMGRIVRRFFLVLITVVIMAVSALVMVLNMVFNGPSPTARNQLTMTLIEASATNGCLRCLSARMALQISEQVLMFNWRMM